MDEGPVVTILLLGNAGCGKSTFLSRLASPSPSPSTPNPNPPLLLDSNQPFPFSITLYNRPYRFEFHDTASPHGHYTLLEPDLVVLCYDISDPRSLTDVKQRWRKEVSLHFRGSREDRLPLVLLGLKRDLRCGKGRTRGGAAEDDDGVVDPMEGYRVAQEMRCDRYAECSALTGELMREVIEDIARVAALTTTDKGGQSDGPNCSIM